MALSLDRFKWKNRLLLVFAPETSDKHLQEQVAEFKSCQKNAAERDMLVLQISLNKATHLSTDQVKQLREEFDVNPEKFCVLLIGKDGTVKMREDTPVSAERVFDLIDSMPMRQKEMKERSS